MADLRPSQRTDDPESFSGSINSGALRPKLTVPKEVKDPGLRAWLTKLTTVSPVVDPELLEIREQLEGGRKAISSKYYPKPNPNMSETLWRQNKKLLHQVNLMRPVQNAYVNAVYSNDVVRTAEENPYKKLVGDWLESDETAQACEDWAGNKVAFGRSVVVPLYDKDAGEFDFWHPDPVYTRVLTDPLNVNRVIGVAEVLKDRIQYYHLKGEGVITPDSFVHEERDFGWLPVAVGYGTDLRSSGRTSGLPMLRDALSATYATTAVMYNVRLLQKQETKNILKRIGNLDELKKRDAGKPVASGDQTVMDLPEGADAEFIGPNPKIEQSIKVLRQQVSFLSTASGIPADVLDPTLTESSSSAEAARIRAVPMLNYSKRLLRQWRREERALALAMTAIVAYYEGEEQPIKIGELKKAVSTFIGMQAAGIPMSPNEETQDIIAKVAFGLMTPEDGVRACNGTKTKAQITEMAAEITKRLEAEGAQAVAQRVLGGGRPAKKKPAAKPAKPPEDDDEEAAA